MPENQWFAFLEEFMEGVPTGELKSITVNEVTVQVTKVCDAYGVRTFIVDITKTGGERVCERYWLEENWGVYDRVFVYTPLVGEPKVMELDLTIEEEAREHAQAYANSIAGFLRGLVAIAILQA